MSFSCQKGEFDRFFNRLDRPVEESRPDRQPDRFPSLIYSNRKNARNADFTKLSIKGVEKIFINENLTYLKKKLFWKSKQKAKEAGFKFFLTMNGNVYVRKLEDDKPILIKNKQDLDLFKWFSS